MIDYTNIMKNKDSYLSKHEIDMMLGYCVENEKYRDYMLILTLWRTGRRITEIVGEKPYTRKVGLRPCDIHEDRIEFDILKKRHIKKKNTKTGRIRSDKKLKELRIKKMPKRVMKQVDSQFMAFLIAYIEDENIKYDERVFPITSRRVQYIIKNIAQKCHITREKGYIHPHHFRHSLAIHFLKNNPNDTAALRQVQQLLDHQDINMTMRYAEFSDTDIKDKLDELFKK